MRKNTFIELIREARFRELFITEMGWNNYRGQAEVPLIEIDDEKFQLYTIAERNGFQILTCEVKRIPTPTQCKRIDVKLRRSANDYIAIFIEKGTEHHQWVAPVRQAEKRDLVTIEYDNADKTDFLFSKIDGLSFDNSEHTTIVDVKERIQGSFSINSEKITKDFYAGFKKEHDAFEKFITGIDDDLDIVVGKKKVENRNKQWYASVMLNRLMFCYFIQKKGFLDNNTNYLTDKLKWCQEEKGNNRFFTSFYKGFLLQLFQDGLNSPTHKREFEETYGKIPYLNGGMFDNHQLERDYKNIDIADEAFERLFAFFDKWRWHLDTRISASGKDINPDVLGYIFEQYINDRASMGAYYTKEDITEYIGRNCILPFLMDKVQHATQETEQLFSPQGMVWKHLQQSGDAYIYNAVKHGYTVDWQQRIPAAIAVGIDPSAPELLERRQQWNTPTPEPWALPTEIWRETIERLQRCGDILSKIKTGEICQINDFITYNLDIRTFVGDLLATTDNHKFVGHFYHALQQVTILDPTCGSGAFLFAAMNILEPLYEVCIDRMMEWNQQNPHLFKDEMAEIHNRYRSNIQYFIYKSIILRNLYGVDIMQEATEIAKLRLFLKMVAVVEVNRRAPNLGLDPLPDIDFNIRCGNTLVGYATENEIIANASIDLFAAEEYRTKVETEMQKVSKTYEIFRTQQLADQNDLVSIKNAKKELKDRLTTLTDLLDHQLFAATGGISFDSWKKSHQPFHWIAEYYQIIQGNGGFDVIIGNPPYVGYTRKNKQTQIAVKDIYKIDNYKTISTSNLYAFTIERSKNIASPESKIGMIIPISAFSNDSMRALQLLMKESFGTLYISTFHQRPAQLFEGVLQRLSIFIADIGNSGKRIFTTGIYRWYTQCRKYLFENLSYQTLQQNDQEHFIKIGSSIEKSIYSKYRENKPISFYLSKSDNKNNVYYRTAGGGYWVTFLIDEFDCVSVSNKHCSFINDIDAKVINAALNSNLFWWYYSINYDLFNFKDYMIFSFKMTYPLHEAKSLKISSLNIERNLRSNATFYEIKSKTRGSNPAVTYNKYLSKIDMDNIDIILAKHYGFTDEELDFIINYDIKYRMGDELNNSEE